MQKSYLPFLLVSLLFFVSACKPQETQTVVIPNYIEVTRVVEYNDSLQEVSVVGEVVVQDQAQLGQEVNVTFQEVEGYQPVEERAFNRDFPVLSDYSWYKDLCSNPLVSWPTDPSDLWYPDANQYTVTLCASGIELEIWTYKFLASGHPDEDDFMPWEDPYLQGFYTLHSVGFPLRGFPLVFGASEYVPDQRARVVLIFDFQVEILEGRQDWSSTKTNASGSPIYIYEYIP